MQKKEKAVQALLWCAFIVLGSYLTARGLLFLRDSIMTGSENVWKSFYSCVEECTAYYLFPGSMYENDTDTGSWLELLINRSGMHTGIRSKDSVPCDVEDMGTVNRIIESTRPSAEEKIVAENQMQNITAENEKMLDTEQNEGGENAETLTTEGEKEKDENQGGQEQASREQDPETANQEGNGETDSNAGNTENGGEDTVGEGGNNTENNAGNTDTGAEAQELPAWTTAVKAVPEIDLSMESLSNFEYLKNQFFVIDENTTTDASQLNAADFLERDMKLESLSDSPQILIYHTHSQEEYMDSIPGDPSTTVIGVGDYLESILRDIYGYQVIHLKNSFDLVDGEVERSKAYNYALPVVEQVLNENPTIEVVIDLHRDGVPEDKHLVTEINGKPTAQIMYFNGLSRTVNNGNLDTLPNPYIADNLAFAFQLSYQAAQYYPDLTRCIYLKGYRYNLHVRPRSILLEVGAQTNTVEEAMNAMEPFSVILNKVLKGE